MATEQRTVIINTPRIKNGLIGAIRELLEHRALWLYMLIDAAGEKGLKPEDFAGQAVTRCGLYQGKHLVAKGGTSSLKGLKKTLFGKVAQWVFEMKIWRSTDDNLDIDFHYCPLVAAWQQQGCSPEEIRQLCDIAMSGDRGIAASYGCHMDLMTAIARGDSHCEVRFARGLESSITPDS